jgi:CHAT domain-containing protein/Tfp pilus assembly protein PilF
MKAWFSFCPLLFVLLFEVNHKGFARTKKELQSLNDSIKKYEQKADFQALIPFLTQKKKWLIKSKDSTGVGMGEVLVQLGECYRKTGRMEESKNALEKCLSLANPNWDERLQLKIFHNLGLTYTRLSAFEQAEKEFHKALKIKEKIWGNESKQAADSKYILGIMYYKWGKFDRAETWLKESIANQEKLLGKNDTSLIDGYNGLGAVYIEWGKLQQAENEFLRCIEILVEKYGKGDIRLAYPLINQGNLQEKLGSYQKAEENFKWALDILIKTYGAKHNEVADCYHNLGVLNLEKNDLTQAEKYISLSLSIKEANHTEKEPEIGLAIFNLGNINYMLERHKEAERLYKESLAYLLGLFEEDNFVLSEIYNNLAGLTCKMGKFEESEAYYLKTKKSYDKNVGKDHFNISNLANRMGMLEYTRKNFEKAESYFLQFAERESKKIRQFFPFLTEEEKEKFIQKENPYWDAFKAFCLVRYSENPLIANDLLKHQIGTKGILLNASAKWRNRIRTQADPALKEKFEKWLKIQNELFFHLHSRKKENLGQVEELENQAIKLEKELNKESENFSRFAEARELNVENLVIRLKPGQALVEIVRIKKMGVVGTFKDSTRSIPSIGVTDTIQYVALILKPNQKVPELVLFPNGAELENEKIRFYRKAVMKHLPDHQSYNAFWGKMATALRDCKTVFFSPDGVFHKLNPNTLWNPSTKKYLLDELDIRILTSGAELINNQEERNFSRQAFLFGNPAYYGPDTSLSSLSREENRKFHWLVPLPSTQAELDKISQLLKSKNWKTTQFQSLKAREDSVKSIKSPGILHLATHGFFRSDSWKQANPLLNSGLMLANSGLPSGENAPSFQEDGILTSAEAMNLDLDNTELVVLSACETGLGEIKNGEGVYGLQRAFKVAGSRSVIMSLWKVNDMATQELMVSFYKHWLSPTQPPRRGGANTNIALSPPSGDLGGRKRSAFLKAQKEIKAKYSSPYYWGAFVLVGD